MTATEISRGSEPEEGGSVPGDVAPAARPHLLPGARPARLLSTAPGVDRPLDLRSALGPEGFEVVVADRAVTIPDALAAHAPELVLLEVTGAHPSDLGSLVHLRALTGLPIVVFRADRSDNRPAWLDAGADDVVPSPLALAELIARVRAVLRRSSTPTPQRADRLVAGDLELDEGARDVRVSGRPVELTRLESRLLRFLMARPGQAFDSAALHREVWGYDKGDLTTVAVYVRRLRRKLEPEPSKPRFILHERGRGYFVGTGLDRETPGDPPEPAAPA